MKKRLLDLLICRDCAKSFTVEAAQMDGDEIITGLLKCACGKKYKIISGIPRFISDDQYLNSFSFEWKVHQKTQLDSYNRRPISESQMMGRVNFGLAQLRAKLVLDAGCGTGRFAEVAEKYGAEVVCVDLSYAVDSAYKNLWKKNNVHILQADIFNLPLKRGIFDLVYSYGVLHHTPDALKAFEAVSKYVKPNGVMSIFVYSSYNKAIVYMSSFWRLFTTRMPRIILYWLSFISVPLYYIYKIPVIGRIGKMIFVIPMWDSWKWRVLDTFDWYSPRYQSKHTHWEVFSWFKNNGFKEIHIYPNEITMSGVKE